MNKSMSAGGGSAFGGRKILLSASILLLAAGCGKTAVTPSPQPVACTQEAKQCADGSYVGRTGPNCEFSACPSPSPTPSSAPSEPGAVACPQIARACPDGSFVHPQGPKCEMPACPTVSSGILGTVTLGPNCPVQRIPPDPACADKPYQATIVVKTADGSKEVARFTSKADGTFKQALQPGTYLLDPVSSNNYPYSSQQTVTVSANKYTQVTISYDTGVR